jgi:bifunctional non-homologous end joining protein LigD
MNLIKVMEPILKSKIITKDDWIHQIKWDGIRGISYINNNDLKIYTKKGNLRANTYPEINTIISQFKGSQCILDGEIVVLDKNLKPSFSEILIRDRMKNASTISKSYTKYPISYVLFDILYFNNRDIRELTWEERNEILQNNIIKSSTITILDSFQNGIDLYNLAKFKNLEGIVSKSVTSKYIAGKNHNDWYKVKITKKMLAIVCGLKMKDNFPNSLVLGIYNNDRLYYVGNVSSGLKQSDLYLLNNFIKNLQQKESIFPNIDKSNNIVWFTPSLTCWINFFEWTNDGVLRHPKIIGFSNEPSQNATGKEFTYNAD